MKRNNMAACASTSIFLVAILAGGAHEFRLTGATVAQTPLTDTAPATQSTPSAPASLNEADAAVDRAGRNLAGISEMLHTLAQPYQQRLDKAMKELREAKNDAETAGAKSHVRRVLSDVFAEEMRNREQRAREVEIRLERLRMQYQERQAVKDKIIELQLKVLEKEAQGFGFLPPATAATMAPQRAGVRDRRPSQSAPDQRDPLNVPATTHDSATVPAPSDTAVTDYHQLRDQHKKARSELRLIERELESLVAEARERNPNATADDVKDQYPNFRLGIELAQTAWQESQRLLDVKLKLLVIDLKAAMIARETALNTLAKYSEMIQRSPNSVSPYEVDKQRAELETANLNVERAQTLYDLFKSIADAGAEDSDSQPSERRGEETKDAGQQQ